MSTLKKFAGQTAIYGTSTILSRVLNFLLTKLYVNIYPAKTYGVFTYMYSWASMLNAVLAFGMETTFFRYLGKHDSAEEKAKVYNNTFISILSVAVLFLIGALSFSRIIAEWIYEDGSTSLDDYETYIRLFTLILITDAIAVIPFARIRADGRPLKYGLIKIVNIVSFIGFNLFFLLIIPSIINSGSGAASFFSSWYRPDWVGYVFISNLIASGITLLLLLPELRKLKLSTDFALIKDMILYSFPILIANLSFIINENSDKIFLKELLPAELSETEVGIYGACCKLAIFLNLFVQAFRLGSEPFFFSHAKKKNARETYSHIMTYFVIAIALIFTGIVANIEILKHFIGSEDPVQRQLYWSGLKIVPVLLFGYVCLGIYMNLSIWYKLSDQTRYGLYISGIGAFLTIALNIILIPKFSYVASAWISLAAYASMMLISFFLGQKNYPIPYNIPKILSYLVISVGIVILSFNVFERNIIIGNLLFISFAAATFYIERKSFIEIMRAKE